MDRPLPPDPPPVPGAPAPRDRSVVPRGGTLPVPRTSGSPVLDPDAQRAPESRMLPPHVGKAGRIGDHLAALSADLREWTELRIALVQRKVEGVVGIFERVQHFVPALKFYVPAAVLALVGALFVLVTLAIGLGALLDAYWAGFLIVTLTLLFTAAVLFALGQRMQKAIEAEVAAAKRKRQDTRNLDLDDVQAAQRASVRQAAS